MIPHARGHRARVGGTILFDGMSQPGGSSAVAARPDPADRSRSGPRDDVRPAQALRAAPRGTTPWVAYRQRATKSFRASATIAIRRTRPRPCPTRSRNQALRAESGWWRRPEPGELDHGVAQPTVAGLRDALLALGPAALPRARRQAGVGGELPSVVETAEQRLEPE